MKNCLYTKCNKEIVITNIKIRNVKYCSPTCRTEHYRETGKLKLAADKFNHKKWDRYEFGKEQCVICQGWYWAVCHHASSRHGVDHREYKEMIGADIGKGRITADLKELKRRQVFENGTVKNLAKGADNRYRKGQEGVGKYKRSLETMARLKVLSKLTLINRNSKKTK